MHEIQSSWIGARFLVGPLAGFFGGRDQDERKGEMERKVRRGRQGRGKEREKGS